MDDQQLENAYSSKYPIRTLQMFLQVSLRRTIWVMFLNIVKTAPLWISPLYLEMVLGAARVPEEYPTHFIVWATVIYLVIILQNIIATTSYMMTTSRYIRQMEMSLRGALVRRLQQLSFSFYGGTESGRLQSKILRDVEDVSMLGRIYYNALISAFIGITFTIVICLVKDPMMLVVFAVLVPLAAIMRKVFKRQMRKYNKEFRVQMENMSSQTAEMVDMVPVARAHGVEDHEVEKMDKQLEHIYQKGMQVDKVNALFESSAWVTMEMCKLGILVIGLYFARNGNLTPERIALYFSLYQLIAMQISGIMRVFPQISRGLEGIRSIGEVLECPDVESNQGKRVINDLRGDISFRDVGFSYDDKDIAAIKNFNLEIRQGECVAFVGESGAGKSTLMNLCIGFWRAQTGSILIDGQPIDTLDMRTVRRHVAVVPQHTILFSGTLRENICYGLYDVEESAVWAAIKNANLSKVVDELPEGLETRIGENGVKLSGGQRQRVAIARAMIRNPKLIILDEATSALDVISEKEVQEAIEHLVAGRTTLIVAHRLSTIRHANRVVVMKDGACIELGSQEELLEQGGEFYELRKLQA